MNNWIFAVLPLAGVITGAVLQYLLTREIEKNKHIEELRAEAYSDYLRAVAASARLRSDDDLVEALKNAVDAKMRILVYGTSPVIKALAKFEKSGAILNNDLSENNFITIVSAMRTKKDTILKDDIRLVLYGTKNIQQKETISFYQILQ
jgi:hypothetical protein